MHLIAFDKNSTNRENVRYGVTKLLDKHILFLKHYYQNFLLHLNSGSNIHMRILERTTHLPWNKLKSILRNVL